MEDRRVYLESPVLGSAIRLRLIYGLIVQALDGRTLAQARDLMLSRLSSVGPEKLAQLGSPADANTDSWLNGQVRMFERRYLPILLKFGILEAHPV